MLERLMILSAILFCVGLYGVLTRRHVVAVLIAVEIMLNGVNVALVALSRYVTPAAMRLAGEVTDVAERSLLSGQAFAAFVVVVAAAEVALGLALVIAIVRRGDSVDISNASVMRH